MTRLQEQLDEAERKAVDSLARYKFMQFGYWAAVWVHLNRLAESPSASPFRSLVNQARILRTALPEAALAQTQEGFE